MLNKIRKVIQRIVIATIIFGLGYIVAAGNKPDLSDIERLKQDILESKAREQYHKDQWDMCEQLIMPTAKEGAKAEREIQDELTKELLNQLGMYNEKWYPGKLSSSGDVQEMPALISTNAHDRFKEMAKDYGLDASMIYKVEEHYKIKEGVILCITVAETSGGNRGAGGKNIGSVGSNDRGDRPTYALMESGLEAIGKTLNNQYLGKIQTLGCLSNAGSCQSWDDNGKRYATSNGNWERNMTSCLSNIYGSVDAKTFNIRR